MIRPVYDKKKKKKKKRLNSQCHSHLSVLVFHVAHVLDVASVGKANKIPTATKSVFNGI